MPGILKLYNRYYCDGLIGNDIVDLIKQWASIPNNETFKRVFLPEIFAVIGQFYN